MKIERTHNTIRNMVWGYIYRIISMILPFVFRSVMIKNLGADYLGVNSLFTSILQVLSLSELGFGTAIVYSMYKPIAQNDLIQICALLNLYKKIYYVVGCIILVVGAILIPFIPHLISGSYPKDINIYFVFFMFLINTSISYLLFAYKGSLLNAFQRNDVESKILILVSLFRYIAEIIGIYVTRQYYIFLVIEILSTIMLNVIKNVCTKKLYPEYVSRGDIDNEQKQKIKENVLALIFHKIGGIVLNSVDNIIISIFMGVIIVSNYGNYFYVLNAVESIIIICFTGMTAGIGNSFVVESIKKNRDNFKKILFFNAWIVGWCSTCLICLYQDFMMIWVGSEYMFSNYIVILFVIYFFCHCIRRTIITFRDGAGMWKDNKWQPIVSAIFNLTVNIILVQIIGVAGILISSIVSILLVDIPWETIKFCHKIEMNIKEYFGQLFMFFLITIIVSLLTAYLTSLFKYSIVVNFIIKIGVCMLVPNIVFWAIYHKRMEYIFFKNIIKQMCKIKSL